METSNNYDRYARFKTSADQDPPVALDLGVHWSWKNPLNVVPLLILVLLVSMLVQMLF